MTDEPLQNPEGKFQTLGEWLEKWRLCSLLTQKDMGALLRIDPKTYHDLENSKDLPEDALISDIVNLFARINYQDPEPLLAEALALVVVDRSRSREELQEARGRVMGRQNRVGQSGLNQVRNPSP